MIFSVDRRTVVPAQLCEDSARKSHTRRGLRHCVPTVENRRVLVFRGRQRAGGFQKDGQLGKMRKKSCHEPIGKYKFLWKLRTIDRFSPQTGADFL